jgi:hypothetical protein
MSARDHLSHIRRYTVPWADFAATPISPVVVDTDTDTITLAGLVCDDILPCPGRPSFDAGTGAPARDPVRSVCAAPGIVL